MAWPDMQVLYLLWQWEAKGVSFKWLQFSLQSMKQVHQLDVEGEGRAGVEEREVENDHLVSPSRCTLDSPADLSNALITAPPSPPCQLGFHCSCVGPGINSFSYSLVKNGIL